MKKYAKVVEELNSIVEKAKTEDIAVKDSSEHDQTAEKTIQFAVAHIHGRNADFSTAGAPYQLRDIILIDSGSVIHVTNNHNRLINFRTCKSEEVFPAQT